MTNKLREILKNLIIRHDAPDGDFPEEHILDQAEQQLLALLPSEDEIEELFKDYEWIEFDGKNVLAIHPDEIAKAIHKMIEEKMG